MAALKPQSNGPSYSNTVIGTLAVDGWAVTFGTARRGLGGAADIAIKRSEYIDNGIGITLLNLSVGSTCNGTRGEVSCSRRHLFSIT